MKKQEFVIIQGSIYFQEQNFWKKLYIKYWYNDLTRVFFVLAGLNLIPTFCLIVFFEYLGLNNVVQYGMNVLSYQYMAIFMFAIIDNDYTNLYKIYKNVNGKNLDSKIYIKYGN